MTIELDTETLAILVRALKEKKMTLNISHIVFLERIMNITKFSYNFTMFHGNSSLLIDDGQPDESMESNSRHSGRDCGGPLERIAVTYAEWYHPYVAITVCTFGTVANILNIAVLTRKDMVCAPINRILTALAVADMMLMIEYIPFAYYYHMDLRGKLDFPYGGAVFTLFHNHITQVLHTISICLTLTLAIWRYLAIGYPEKNHILCTERRCTLAIVLSYLLPIILCAPSFFTLEITTTEIYEDKKYILYHTDLKEVFRKDKTLLMINFWIYAVFIKLLPCCILTIISCWLIHTLFKAKKRKQVLRSYDSYPLTFNIENKDVKRKPSKAERRADRTTRMLVAVLLLFLMTEFPQGLFAFFIGLRGKDLFLECYQQYGEVMDILALLNGAINFILYCCMNRMFRATFDQLFKYKLLSRWVTQAQSSDVHTTQMFISKTPLVEDQDDIMLKQLKISSS